MGACVYKFFSPSNSVYKPPLCFWCGAILRCFQIQISLFFKGACVYNPCTVSNLDMLRFNKFFQIQTRFILYVEWGPMCIFLVIVVTPLTSHFGLCLFFFSNNGCVILCVMWRGPVSISFFSPSNSIYKPPLCFDRVGLAFSFSNNGCVILCVIWWGPVSISYSLSDVVGAWVYKFFYHPIKDTNLLYALIVYSTLLDTMIYLWTHTNYKGIFWHYLANSGTYGYT